MERVDLSKVDFTPALRTSLPPATARLYEIVPVRQTPQQVVLALPPMRLLQARDDELQTLRIELRCILGREVDFVIADRDQIREYVRRLYGESHDRSAGA
jgi:type II secretion system (T2SS) protein E